MIDLAEGLVELVSQAEANEVSYLEIAAVSKNSTSGSRVQRSNNSLRFEPATEKAEEVPPGTD